MTQMKFGGSAVLAALLMSSSAMAQVTPEQVWQNWKDLGAAYDQTITATSEVRSGDTLTITGMNLVSEFEGGSVTGTIDMVAFRDLGDGTVEVTQSPEVPLVLSMEGAEAEKVTAKIVISQPGLKLIAAGTGSETRYDFNGPKVGLRVSDVMADGVPFDLTMDIGLIGLAGNYLVNAADKTTLASAMTADSMSIAFNMLDPDPATGGSLKLDASLGLLSANTSAVLLGAEAMEDMPKALADGFSTDATFTYGATSFQTEFAEPASGLTAASGGTLGGGSFAFGFNKDRLQYGGGAKDVAMTISGSQIPFPELAIGYADSAFNFLMPIAKSETPGAFEVLTRIVDLTVSEEVWAMFDPAVALPRDPATLVIDSKGTANWLVDIMSPEAAAMETVPGELHSLDIAELTLRAVGASITGAGAFTFDNTDTVTFDGMPAPTGKMDLVIVGANGLLDKLVGMGLLPNDQAMGARMMMGLFARPGDGVDTLTTTLEFKDKGFFANGQQLQ